MSQLSVQPSDLLLPAGTHLIHVGPQKTGSTAIQNALHATRDRHAEHGVLYASLGVQRPREAGWYVLGRKAPVGRPEPRPDQWEALCREVAAADPSLRVCISNEDYGRARPAEIRTIVDGVGGEHPHVVLVVRRLDRFLPSMWQERVKAREHRTFEQWLEVILDDQPDSWDWNLVWYPHRGDGLVRRWADVVGPENVTVVVSREGDRTFLPSVFESLLGLPSGMLELDDLRGNRSLSLEESELMRHLNEKFWQRGWPGEAYKTFVQGGATKGLKQRPRPAHHHAGPGYPAWAVEKVRELCAQQAEAIAGAGARVVGDPKDLLAPDDLGPGVSTVDEVDMETAVRLAEFVVEKALDVQDRQASRRRRSERRVGRRQPASTTAPDLDAVPGRALAAALGARIGTRVADRVRAVRR